MTGVTFNPSIATIANLFPTPPADPTLSLTATSAPQLSPGETSGPAGTWTLNVAGNSTAGAGWVDGDTVVVTIAPPSGSNCNGDDYLSFAGTPTASVDAWTGLSATPSVATSVTNGGPCGGSEPNELVIEFTGSAWFQTTGSATISVHGVRYTVGPGAAAEGVGLVQVAASYHTRPISSSGASNAYLGGLSVEADTPPVSVVPRAFNSPISPIEVVESSTAHVQAGYVCLTIGAGTFDLSSTPAATVVVGNGHVGANVSLQLTHGTGPTAVVFEVVTPSTTPASYRVSGLAVDAPSAPGPVDVMATEGTSADCTSDTGSIGKAVGYTVASTALVRVYGATADATAAAELEHQFGTTGTNCPGRPGARPVVLATDASYQDALASAYLASYLGTGELLTPGARLSSVTATAMREEGITTVYIVGGPLAVSDNVYQQLLSLTAYTCGGVTRLTPANPVHLEVHRIWGQTAYDTAQFVAQYPPPATVGVLNVPGAYVGTNATDGRGQFNDTAGTASTPPASASTLATAILATGRGFQDAEAAGVVSYADRLPLLLTTPRTLSPQVTSAVAALQIKQVIVMGGQLAVSDSVVTSLERLGLTVLRIAGRDYTDTAAQLADFELASRVGQVGLGWTATGGVTVARGDFYSDGVAGAVLVAGAGRTHTHSPEPLLLSLASGTVGAALKQFLHTAGRIGIDGVAANRVSHLTVLGGPLALTTAAVGAMTADL